MLLWLACSLLLAWVVARTCGARRSAPQAPAPAAVAEDAVQPLHDAVLNLHLGGGEFVDYCAAIARVVGGRSFRNHTWTWMTRLADVGIRDGSQMWVAGRTRKHSQVGSLGGDRCSVRRP